MLISPEIHNFLMTKYAKRHQWTIFYLGKPLKFSTTGVKSYISYKVARRQLIIELSILRPQSVSREDFEKSIDFWISTGAIEIKKLL